MLKKHSYDRASKSAGGQEAFHSCADLVYNLSSAWGSHLSPVPTVATLSIPVKKNYEHVTFATAIKLCENVELHGATS